jgi:hypothetical protein
MTTVRIPSPGRLHFAGGTGVAPAAHRFGLGTRRSLLVTLLPLMAGLVACGDDGKGSFNTGDNIVVDVNPNPVTFATVATGTHAEQVVTVRHEGTDGTLRLGDVRIVSASTELTLTAPGKTELRPGEFTTMVVNYDPLDTVRDSGTLLIPTNAASAGGFLTVEVPIVTAAQAGVLRAIPDPVNFGDVEVGDVATKTVTLLNIGSDTASITSISVQNGLDGDPFSVSFLPTLPTEVAPNETITLELAYAPLRAGGDAGNLIVAFSVQGTPGEMSPVQLSGLGVGARLVAFPNPVDFGWRAVEQTHKQVLTIANQGTRELVLNGVELAEGSSPTISWENFPAAGTRLAPNQVASFDVTFTPTSDMVQTTGPIGTLVFLTNDLADGGRNPVDVYGRAEVPVLQVNPPDVVDFAFVAQNLTNRRSVSLYNAGSAPLRVTSITLTDAAGGEFEIEPDNWGPTSSTPTEAILAPTEYRAFTVKFTNRGASSGTQWGKLRINSTDGARPQWDIDLKAQRAGSPVCEVALVPSQLDFGTVARGFRRTMTANLINTGSGDCSFHSALVNDCASFMGFFDGSCTDPNTTPQLNGTSSYYKVTRTPPAIQNGLKPGQSYPIEVTFTPPDSAPIFGDDMTDYAGLLAVRIIDPYSGSTVPVVYPRPRVGGISAYPPNLHAKSGIAQLAVLPSEVDFGLTTVGCHSQTITVTAYNVGSAPLDLTDIKLQGCSPEFRIKASPGLPSTLALNGNEEVEVVYVPQNVGADACGLAFYTNNEVTPTIVVPLSGEGTFESEHTDTYVQTTGQDVDVLFVVDNSGSMSEEQSNLASNFQSFISGAATWNNDYHVGVTSTDLEADNGRLMSSGSNARFVTRANWQQFANNARLGTNGSGDEKGLATAQAALSLPNTADAGTTCSTDAECTTPERCVDGGCGGRNRGFLREEAALEVVIVSDEEDASPGDLAFYTNFFKSIKGFYNTNMFHLHAIVGDYQNGCNSNAGSASAGNRYIAVANNTGGAVVSICDPTFATGLTSIGDIAFGLRTQFFLGRVPEPTTIAITVAGAGCVSNSGANWVYDANSNSVVFAENGSCMPQAGQTVAINYRTVCFLQ